MTVPSPPGAAAAQAPLLLVERLAAAATVTAAPPLRLALTAQERSGLRGRRRTLCGRDLLLQLPRGRALEPGELLATAAGSAGPLVRVEAAPEPLLQVRSGVPLALLQAAYHLGNRHVALEIHADRLVLLDDSVLADLLAQRGLTLERLTAPFLPEPGAYGGPSSPHAHSHSHSHSHGHGH